MEKKLSIAVLLCLALLVVARAEPLQLAPHDGVLLLHNGSVLKGKITRAGDRYLVAVPGGEIRVRAERVLLLADNLDQAYQMRRTAVAPGLADQHLQLAEWCLQQDLFGYAAEELLAARFANPNHPRLTHVERRMQLLRRPPSESKPRSSPEPTAVPENRGDEMDELVRSLPPGSVEHFTQSIQPLLLNGCATAGCHSRADDNRLQLHPLISGRPLTRRITRENLQSVLKFIEGKSPEGSPLWTKATSPHGNLERPPLQERHQRQRALLRDWLQLVTVVSQQSQPETVQPPAEPLLLSIDQWFQQPASEATAPHAVDSPQTSNEPSVSRPQPLQRGAPPARPVAEDPFDPELFNRRFSRRAPAASKE